MLMAKLADLCGILRQGNRCKSNFYPFVYRLGCNQMVSILLEESFSCCSKSCFLNQLIARANMPRFPAPCQRVWMLARTMKVKAYKVAARIQVPGTLRRRLATACRGRNKSNSRNPVLNFVGWLRS